MFAKVWERSCLLPQCTLTGVPTKKEEKKWSRMATVKVVRRSARLIAAATLETPEKSLPSKRAKAVPEARFSSKKSNRSSQGSPELNEEGANDTEKGATAELGLHESPPVEELRPKLIVDTKERKEANVRRSKILKRLPSRDTEMKLWELGFKHVAGVDEAGRGPLAGPVVAAACIIPADITIPGVDDSKKLNESQRDELYAQIIATPGVTYAVDVVDAAKIDEINILQATLQAMSACVKKLTLERNGEAFPDYILVDGNRLPDDFSKEKAQFVIKGDAECHVIAAASILAKVTRDRMMLAYDKKWPEYGFKAHKGYGTAAHIGALLKHGPCDIHRRSFAPLKDQILLNSNCCNVSK